MRPSDIIDFERYFMKVISKEQGRRLTLTQEAERQLLAYSFPDNINVSTTVGNTGVTHYTHTHTCSCVWASFGG